MNSLLQGENHLFLARITDQKKNPTMTLTTKLILKNEEKKHQSMPNHLKELIRKKWIFQS
jgi:hypothetical protein